MSAALPTKDLAISLDAVDDGSGYVTVSANLEARTANDQNNVLLSPGDTLSATYGKSQYPMAETSDGRYVTTLPLTDVANLTVGLDRSKFTKAPQSQGILPESVELDLTGATISRSLDDIVLDLPATQGFKSVDLSGPCISTIHEDVGTAADVLTLSAGSVYSSYAGDECYVDVTVTCELDGSPDPALNQGSTFTLRRTRTTSFYSVP